MGYNHSFLPDRKSHVNCELFRFAAVTFDLTVGDEMDGQSLAVWLIVGSIAYVAWLMMRGDNRKSITQIIAEDQDRQRDVLRRAGVDIDAITPEVGREIAWTDVIRQVFRVLDFDRAGTRIGPGNTVHAASPTSPYGYLLVESPILNQAIRLPIVHRDDFLLAASVYAEPPLLADTKFQELLVTYAPEHELPGGLAGASHALHYVITPRGTLDRYYDEKNDQHMRNPMPQKLFGQFVWKGEISVKINRNPNL
jgi:hypothetical protein